MAPFTQQCDLCDQVLVQHSHLRVIALIAVADYSLQSFESRVKLLESRGYVALKCGYIALQRRQLLRKFLQSRHCALECCDPIV
jgi:hypothetical protein